MARQLYMATYTTGTLSWVLISLAFNSNVVAMATAEMSAAEENIDGAIAPGGVPNLLASQYLAELLGPRLAALDARGLGLQDTLRAQGRMLAAQSRTITSLQSELKDRKNPGGTMSQQKAGDKCNRRLAASLWINR